MKQEFLAQGDTMWAAALPTVVFVAVFALTVFWVMKRGASSYSEMERLPLEDGSGEM